MWLHSFHTSMHRCKLMRHQLVLNTWIHSLNHWCVCFDTQIPFSTIEYSWISRSTLWPFICFARPLAAMVLTLQDKWGLIFHKEIFQLPVPTWCWEMIGNVNTFSCYYNVVQYNVIVHTAQQWLKQSICLGQHSQKILHISLSGAGCWSACCEIG